MGKVDVYRRQLREMQTWEPYLLRESGLPGPRGNLELAQAVAEEASAGRLAGYLVYGPQEAPEGSAEVFLAFCGVLGLARSLPGGGAAAWRTLRSWASDPRWRIREAVAMALQRHGDHDMPGMLAQLAGWVSGNCLERRAVAAAIAEPRLLRRPEAARSALDLMDRVTATLAAQTDRRDPDFRSLRQGLGYAWSVVVAASPPQGKSTIERWLVNLDPDIVWVMRENLGKARLMKMDAGWTRRWQARLRR